MIRVFVAPSSSSSSRAWVASVGRSPESSRIPPSSGPAHLDGVADALVDVVGVDEQRRPRAEGGHLGAEGRDLVVVQQRERVRAGARRRDAVAASGLEVGARAEADQVRRSGGGDGRLLVGAPRAHLDARAFARRGDHAGRGGGDGAVVVEDRQRQGLEQNPLGERGPDGEHRRAREVEIALGVAVDVAAEAEAGQPVQQPRVGEPLLAQAGQLAVAEAEVRQRLEQPRGTGDDAEAAAVREPAGEDLEHAVPVGGAVGQCRGHHRQLVPVGEQGGSRGGRFRGRHGRGA